PPPRIGTPPQAPPPSFPAARSSMSDAIARAQQLPPGTPASPAFAPALRRGEPSFAPALRRGEPSFAPTLRRGEPSFAPALRRGGPSFAPEPRRASRGCPRRTWLHGKPPLDGRDHFVDLNVKQTHRLQP